jgi:hypothetical protein
MAALSRHGKGAMLCFARLMLQAGPQFIVFMPELHP